MSLITSMKKRPILFWNAALFLPAAVSLCGGIYNALRPGYSEDFQWSGTHLALHRIDPYHQFLLHDPGHLILMTQVPNYLHELYILLLPLGAMSFSSARLIWLVLNCLFTVAILAILRNIYALDRAKTLLLALLLLASTPYRIVLGAGTESLLELMFFCLFFYLKGHIKRGLILGLSYLKYSFSPVLVFYLAFRRQYRMLAISLVPPLVGLLLMWLLVGGNLVSLATEPLVVSRNGVSPGLGDLMMLVHIAFDHMLQKSVVGGMTYAAALLASAGYAFILSRQNGLSVQREAAALAVGSLMFFPHLTYDFVFLIVPVAACLAGSMNKTKTFVLVVCSLILYAVKLVPMFGPSLPREYVVVAVFLLLSGLLMMFGRPDFAPASPISNQA
jgi:hypothetical protein